MIRVHRPRRTPAILLRRGKEATIQLQALGRPGYYWLAYRWSNLFFACQLCNQRFKKNLFPLRDPARRALSHHHDLSCEEPLLIDPARTTPSVHLGFREEYAYARTGSQMGETTINALGLNRPELVEVRRDRLENLKLLHASRDYLASLAKSKRSRSGAALLQKLEAALERSVRDSAEYAAMTRAALSAD